MTFAHSRQTVREGTCLRLTRSEKGVVAAVRVLFNAGMLDSPGS